MRLWSDSPAHTMYYYNINPLVEKAKGFCILNICKTLTNLKVYITFIFWLDCFLVLNCTILIIYQNNN